MKQQNQSSKSQRNVTPGYQPNDIIDLILEDHKPLKKLLETMKDLEADPQEREDALAEFAPLLVTHAKPEEQSLYTFMKADAELREEGFEGDVEHQLADQLVEELKRTEDPDLRSAQIKVLAELVEHHIEEEEEDLLPDFKKNSNPVERQQLGEKFLVLKTALLEKGGDDSPPESSLSENQH